MTKKKNPEKLKSVKKFADLANKGIQMIELKELKFADYNPKRFSSKQFSRLSMSLDNYGWILPAVVNIRTSNVVDGNQRLKKEMQKGDWTVKIPTIFIDVDLKTEKEINVALNSTSTPTDPEMMYRLLSDMTGSDLMEKIKEDYEKMKQKLQSELDSTEFEIVREVDEKYNYVVALFEKGVDYINVESFFNLKQVYDPKRDRLIGKGRVIKGEKLLKLIAIANREGYKNIDELP